MQRLNMQTETSHTECYGYISTQSHTQMHIHFLVASYIIVCDHVSRIQILCRALIHCNTRTI